MSKRQRSISRSLKDGQGFTFLLPWYATQQSGRNPDPTDKRQYDSEDAENTHVVAIVSRDGACDMRGFLWRSASVPLLGRVLGLFARQVLSHCSSKVNISHLPFTH
jgi:hypothetical protein